MKLSLSVLIFLVIVHTSYSACVVKQKTCSYLKDKATIIDPSLTFEMLGNPQVYNIEDCCQACYNAENCDSFLFLSSTNFCALLKDFSRHFQVLDFFYFAGSNFGYPVSK
jgi:hypothetical protein